MALPQSSSCTCTTSPQSVGGHRAGETGGGSSGSPLCMKPHGCQDLPDRADVPDGERRDGPPQLVIARKHPVITMPMLPRRRDEIGEPVQKLKRRELDDAIGSRPRGLPPTTPPDPVGRLVSREHGADADDAAVGVADHGEPFKREWRPGAVSEKVLENLKIAGHIAVDERDPDEKRPLKTRCSPRRACRRRPRRLGVGRPACPAIASAPRSPTAARAPAG
jgi:hypothetical protein